MKNLSLFAAALLLAACSTSNKVAQLQDKDYNDDVYFSEAKAKEEVVIVKTEPKKEAEKTYRTDEELYGGRNYSDNDYYDDYYDNSYINRINRFYHYSPWNRYYSYNFNPWYDYYGYNNWYSPGLSLYIGINPWRYNNAYAYGYPYSSRYWGPISYNNYFPGYGYGGGYGGGYYSGIKDPNYRPRPIRGAENIGGMQGIGTIRTDAQGRILTSPSRGEIYERNNPTTGPTGRTTSTPNNNGNSAPRSRPERTQTTERPAPTRVQQDNSPRQSEPRQSSGGSSSGGSNDDSGSRARPSRVGN